MIEFVKKERQNQPLIGARKLHFLLNQTDDPHLKIGRDNLINLLRANQMLNKKKRRYLSMTDFGHKFKIYPNLMNDLIVERANQVWISDITYLRTMHGFVYLFLLTDYYSRKIVGSYVSSDLTAESAVIAFRKAISSVGVAKGLIHHSDHGIQYCSKKYVSLLQKHNVTISMTGKNRCYDNAVAERIIGILKQEFFLDRLFDNLHQARIAVSDAIRIYNYKRLHYSLQYKTPANVYAAQTFLAEAEWQDHTLHDEASVKKTVNYIRT